MALDDFYSNLIFFLRWIHIMAGIVWLGHLYFFNFVNANFQPNLPKEMKPTVNPQLLHRALWWFRWGAMTTFVIGLVLLFVKYSGGNLWHDGATGQMTHRAMWILFGALLGTIMWFNVWFIIWPIQKQVITAIKNGTAPDAKKVRTAYLASRTNTYLSLPMLFCMGGASHFPQYDWLTLAIVTVASVVLTWHLIEKVAPKVGSNF